MVEIVKEGKLPGERWYTGTCTNCKTQIRFQQKEAKRAASYGYDYGGNEYYVKCPLTGCSSDVYGKLEPEINLEKFPKINPYPPGVRRPATVDRAIMMD